MTPPVFAHGHLRLYLLSLLADAPMHGYEVIQALEERFGGTYVPSAGTIYPRLAKLEEDGLVSKAADGRKTVYAITDAGRAELLARAGELDGIEDGVTDSVRRLADDVRSSVNSAMKTLRADLASAAREARTEAKVAGRTIRADAKPVQVENRNQLANAEVAINEFRLEMRAKLRKQVTGGQLSDETVAALTAGLAEVRARVEETLGR
ncbi:DNA-binding PadR family transcriptional regulator [Conyzicola lurida]|uniref:DNA-binding PadR family transcriptional regulator n=1 Tax=Conyzicola lurida TaxID=1172621 RepID=A0A841AUJ7_9MICO|nr:DNA-binding PadR family transcriptional regulator [Conyzicola lurida]